VIGNEETDNFTVFYSNTYFEKGVPLLVCPHMVTRIERNGNEIWYATDNECGECLPKKK